MTVKQFQRQRLQNYLACEEAILNGAQSYTIGSRTYTRADLEDIQSAIESLIDSGVTLEDEPVRGRHKRVVFID